MPELDRERTLNRPSIRDGYHDSTNLYNDGRVIRWFFFGSWALIDLTLLQPLSSIRRKQKVVDTNATVVFKGPPEIVPERVLASFARMERTECVDISQAEHRAVTGPRLRLKQCVVNPRGWFVAVHILWNDVEVAALWYPNSSKTAAGNSEPLSSCSSNTSTFVLSSHFRTCSVRARIEFTFQLAIRIFGPSVA
jgi:hypothetical protein